MLKVKSKMISTDAADHLWKCGKIWREYLKGNEVIVVTEHPVTAFNLFGDYYNVLKIGIDKGLVKMLTLSQVEVEHLDMTIVEF